MGPFGPHEAPPLVGDEMACLNILRGHDHDVQPALAPPVRVRSRQLSRPNRAIRHREARDRGGTRCPAQESGGMGDAISEGPKRRRRHAMPCRTDTSLRDRTRAESRQAPARVRAHAPAHPRRPQPRTGAPARWSGGARRVPPPRHHPSRAANLIPPPRSLDRSPRTTADSRPTGGARRGEAAAMATPRAHVRTCAAAGRAACKGGRLNDSWRGGRRRRRPAGHA